MSDYVKKIDYGIALYVCFAERKNCRILWKAALLPDNRVNNYLIWAIRMGQTIP